ncbi:hypothetical protein WJX72_008400 [[Myrmecia] bisecta]|uniref:Uncharacterized protein n=1 Tax=[Myrmecia] bisecta TaxID=41462 RepID=A0AAW1Q1A6_9CHLO
MVTNTLRESRLKPGLQSAIDGITVLNNYTAAVLTDKAVWQELLAFQADLFIVDAVAGLGFTLADKLGVPKAMVSVAGLLPPIDVDLYGLGANNLAHVPQFNTEFTPFMTFWQRVQNTFAYAALMLVSRTVIAPLATSIWADHNIAPYNVYDSMRNLSLVIASEDFAVASARPVSPHYKVVGPLTAKPARPLMGDLRDFMDSSEAYGVVYASFGTTAVPEPHELQAVATALSALAPIKAIWKLSKQDQELLRSHNIVPGPNVVVVEWVPQNDLLGHANLKAFLTQAGTNSQLEALYHGIPFVGLPMMGEQADNVAEAAFRGAAIKVSLHDSKHLAVNLEKALRTLCQDPSYQRAARVVSHRMRAHRQSPAEIAADALEHAAWTNGSTYLRSGQNPLPWYKECLLDVLGFLALVVILAGVSVWMVCAAARRGIRFMLHRFWGAPTSTERKVQ